MIVPSEKIVAPVLGILVAIAFEVLFWDVQYALLAGIMAIGVTNTYTLLSEAKEHKNHTTSTIAEHIRKIVDVLKIQNAFFDDKWLNSVFNELVELIKTTHPHDLERVKGVISGSLQNSKEAIGSPMYYEEKNELERMVHINKAVNNTQQYVCAVTFDTNNYFENFWQGVNEDYVTVNLEAAKRGVMIERIFVMSETVLQPKSKDEKARKFRAIVNSLKKGGENIKIYAVPLERLQQQAQINPVSFFICDGVIASEAGDDKEYFGYFSLNRADIVEKLRDRFDSIKLLAKEL